MNKKFTIYLAGKMSGLTFDQMNEWRVRANRLLKKSSENNIHTISPCDYYNFEMHPKLYTEKEIKEFDIYMVKRSQLILVNLEYPDTIGTAIELYEAHDIQKKPVIAFGETKERPAHPWMKECITKQCETLEQAVQHIMDYYYPNL